MAHFNIPLNLPHAGTISTRIASALGSAIDLDAPENRVLGRTVQALQVLLLPYRHEEENPEPGEAERVRQEAAHLGRLIVDELERRGIKGDRLGQCVRNLFECLEMGEEGASISLRAGEDPKSLQRPY